MDFLKLPLSIKVILVLTLVLTIAGCKKGGVTDVVDPEVEEPIIISSNFNSNDISFLPGEMQLITIQGYTLQDSEFEATVGSNQVTLYRYSSDTQNKTLLFFVPEEQVKDHTLVFSLEGQEQSLGFSIEEYEIIEDANAYLEDFKATLSAELTALIDQTENEEVKLSLNQSVAELDEVMDEFAGLSEEDQRDIVRIISTSMQLEQTSGKINSLVSASSNTDCEEQTNKLLNAPKRVLGLTGPSITANTFFETVKANVLHVFTLARLKEEIYTTIDDLSKAIMECVAPIFTMESASKQKSSGLLFDHEISSQFTINSTKTLPDTFQNALEGLQESIGNFLSLLPDSWVSKLTDTETTITEPADTQAFEIVQISDSIIEGTLTAVGSEVTLTFSYTSEDVITAEAQDFAFTIGDDSGTIDATATLYPPVPVSYPGQFTTDIFESYSDTLLADYAGSFSIVQSPEHGTLTIQDQTTGLFEYTPNDEVTGGTDQFTFTASNSAGTSDTTMVTINLTSPYIGTWSMVEFENGKLPGEYVIYSYTESCNFISVEYTLTQETLVIGIDTWSTSGNERVKTHYREWENDCTVLSHEIEIIDYPYNESSTYTRNGTQITTQVDGSDVTGEVTFITEDRIKIGGTTYVRN